VRETVTPSRALSQGVLLIPRRYRQQNQRYQRQKRAPQYRAIMHSHAPLEDRSSSESMDCETVAKVDYRLDAR
jgi:hypothetical protein